MATTSFSGWDFSNYHVQSEMTGGQFINAESTLIAAGPKSLSNDPGQGAADPGTSVYPIGLLETFGLQQSRQLQRIFEIGSSRSYFIPGRTIGSVNIGRTFYHGPNLLKVLYAGYNGNAGGTNVTKLLDPGTGLQLHRAPGSQDFLIDLASDLFAQPFGMAVYFKDANHDTYGAFYLESCYVQGHQMTVSSGSVLIMEGASLQYDILVPINVTNTSAVGVEV
jgi:hypothetical protein